MLPYEAPADVISIWIIALDIPAAICLFLYIHL